MKLHRPLVNGITSALQQIFTENKYADKVLQQLLRSNRKWGSRDRSFVAEQVYDMVRWWRLLCRLGNVHYESPPLDDRILTRLLGVHLLLNGEQLPDWEEFRGLQQEEILRHKTELSSQRAIAQSIPDWLDETASKEIGKNWDELIEALNQTADVTLRVNTLKTTREELKNQLNANGWPSEVSPLSDDALILLKRGNIFSDPLFKKGLFEVQDAGSQCIAPFLDVSPGMRVIDACAGAGGKTLHLASLMKNKGTVIAMDIYPLKLEELRKRARRNGVDICTTRLIESKKTIKRLRHSADRLLIDAPCSGLGVLRRNPDAKWKLSPVFLDKVRKLQEELLDSYSAMLRPSGKMVYATCSILPSENEKQVKRFLEHHTEFRLLEEKHISPVTHNTDGFYMALLERDATG